MQNAETAWRQFTIIILQKHAELYISGYTFSVWIVYVLCIGFVCSLGPSGLRPNLGSPPPGNHELFSATSKNVEISTFHFLTLWKYVCIRPFIPGILLFCLDFAVFCRNFHKPFFPTFWNPWGTRARHTCWIILPFFRDYSQLTHRQTPRCDGAMLK